MLDDPAALPENDLDAGIPEFADELDSEIPQEQEQEIPAETPDASTDIYTQLQRSGKLTPQEVQHLRERTVEKSQFTREIQGYQTELQRAQQWIDRAMPLIQSAQAQAPKDPVEQFYEEHGKPESPEQQAYLDRLVEAHLAKHIGPLRQEMQPLHQARVDSADNQLWDGMRGELVEVYGSEFVDKHDATMRQQFKQYKAQGGIVHPMTLAYLADKEGAKAAMRKQAQAVDVPKKPIAMSGFEQGENPQMSAARAARARVPAFKDPTRELMREADAILAESRRS